jgi:thioesterase DpgC
VPPVSTRAQDAVAAVADFLRGGAELLARLPAKTARGPDEHRLAADIHHACRNVRAAFVRTHGPWLYDALTGGRTKALRLSEVAFAAAALVTGLVPTPEQIAQERAHKQLDKEGFEIDQGILLSGLLRDRAAGTHLMQSMLRPTARALALLPEFRRTGEIELGVVRIARRERAAHLTVHNDEYLNAEDDRLTDDMETAVDLALLDDGVHVGVLRGGPMTHRRYLGRRVFSAGINLIHLRSGQISFVDFLLRRELGFISKIVRGLLPEEREPSWRAPPSEKPWLAAVDSFAIGGGAQLLLVFDQVIAAADSYFSLPAAREGIVPGAANFRLPRFAGARMTRQIIIGDRKVWASEPDARLLFDEVVDPAAMDAAVEAAVGPLDNPAVVANRRMINLAEEPLDAFRQYMAEFALDQVERIYSPDVIDTLNKFGAR